MRSILSFLRSHKALTGLAAATLAVAALLMLPSPPREEAAPAAAGVNHTGAPPVFIYGKELRRDKVYMYFPDSRITAEELLEKLGEFPRLERVDLPNARFSLRDQNRLRQAFPNVLFKWPVTVCGREFLSTDRVLDFDGAEDLTEKALDEIRKKADGFPCLETVDLAGCALPGETLHQLDLDLGEDVDVKWTFSLYGVTVCSTDEEIDLSRHKARDNGAAVEQAVPWMPHLQKVVMCHCGLTNQRMDELNHRFEGVRFVWAVHVEWAFVRTDSDFFIPYKESGLEQTAMLTGLSNLKYCPDLIALDIGHTKSDNITYLAVMPNIRYLIMAEAYVLDISLVGTLKDLEWLEMFQGCARDLSPLLNCTNLKHLNICYINTPADNLFETLSQMTWLERLWCTGTPMSVKQIAALREALPNTEIWCVEGDESTGGTWRFDEAYYQMRDAFHMYYMDIKGRTVPRQTAEELAATHIKYWGY